MFGQTFLIPAGCERKTKTRDHVVETRDDRNHLLIPGGLHDIHVESAIDLVGPMDLLVSWLLGRQSPKLLLEFLQAGVVDSRCGDAARVSLEQATHFAYI